MCLVDDEKFLWCLFREQEILHHDEELESFYSSFVALATHYICVGIGTCMYSILCISHSFAIMMFVKCHIEFEKQWISYIIVLVKMYIQLCNMQQSGDTIVVVSRIIVSSFSVVATTFGTMYTPLCFVLCVTKQCNLVLVMWNWEDDGRLSLALQSITIL